MLDGTLCEPCGLKFWFARELKIPSSLIKGGK
jgi:hypothetical protein